MRWCFVGEPPVVEEDDANAGQVGTGMAEGWSLAVRGNPLNLPHLINLRVVRNDR